MLLADISVQSGQDIEALPVKVPEAELFGR
jgi:hypothetical protein